MWNSNYAGRNLQWLKQVYELSRSLNKGLFRYLFLVLPASETPPSFYSCNFQYKRSFQQDRCEQTIFLQMTLPQDLYGMTKCAQGGAPERVWDGVKRQPSTHSQQWVSCDSPVDCKHITDKWSELLKMPAFCKTKGRIRRNTSPSLYSPFQGLCSCIVLLR